MTFQVYPVKKISTNIEIRLMAVNISGNNVSLTIRKFRWWNFVYETLMNFWNILMKHWWTYRSTYLTNDILIIVTNISNKLVLVNELYCNSVQTELVNSVRTKWLTKNNIILFTEKEYFFLNHLCEFYNLKVTLTTWFVHLFNTQTLI